MGSEERAIRGSEVWLSYFNEIHEICFLYLIKIITFYFIKIKFILNNLFIKF